MMGDEASDRASGAAATVASSRSLWLHGANWSDVIRVTRLSVILAWLLLLLQVAVHTSRCFLWEDLSNTFTTVSFRIPPSRPGFISDVRHRPGSSPFFAVTLFDCSWFPFFGSPYGKDGWAQSNHGFTPAMDIIRQRIGGKGKRNKWGVVSCPAYDECLPPV
ncbi:hypothetical protein BKA80DRAFT_129946 [Phyllosticta citrichinensis]